MADKDDKKDGEKKKGDVDILAGENVEDAKSDKKSGVKGPTTGERAPLFDVTPDLNCEFSFSKDGELVVGFSRATKEWALTRREAAFACDLMTSHSRQLPVHRRSAADADEQSIDAGAKFTRKSGKLVVVFPQSQSKWKLSKLEALLAIGHMRAELRALPQLKA